MTPDDRADLLFALADVLNEYDDQTGETEAVREAAMGFVRGWSSA